MRACKILARSFTFLSDKEWWWRILPGQRHVVRKPRKANRASPAVREGNWCWQCWHSVRRYRSMRVRLRSKPSRAANSSRRSVPDLFPQSSPSTSICTVKSSLDQRNCRRRRPIAISTLGARITMSDRASEQARSLRHFAISSKRRDCPLSWACSYFPNNTYLRLSI